MIPDDTLIVALRVVALIGFLIGLWPSVRRVFDVADPQVRRTRVALALLLLSVVLNQLSSVAYRLFDYQTPMSALIVALGSTVAGVAVAAAFWPWRRS